MKTMSFLHPDTSRLSKFTFILFAKKFPLQKTVTKQ